MSEESIYTMPFARLVGDYMLEAAKVAFILDTMARRDDELRELLIVKHWNYSRLYQMLESLEESLIVTNNWDDEIFIAFVNRGYELNEACDFVYSDLYNVVAQRYKISDEETDRITYHDFTLTLGDIPFPVFHEHTNTAFACWEDMKSRQRRINKQDADSIKTLEAERDAANRHADTLREGIQKQRRKHGARQGGVAHTKGGN